MNRSLCYWIAATALTCSTAFAQPAGVSFEQLAATSDLVIVAKMSSVGELKDFRLKWTEGNPPEEAKLRAFRLSDVKVLQSSRAGTAIAATAPASDLAELAVWAADFRAAMLAKLAPAMAKDGQYVLFLRRMPEDKGLFLPLRRAFAADEAVVKTATAACKVDAWPWGKESAGLKMALLIAPEVQAITGGAMPIGGRPSLNLAVPCTLAVRNVSDKPIALDLYDQDRVLSVKAFTVGVRAGGGVESPAVLYHDPGPNQGAPAPYHAAFSILVGPGQIALIGRTAPEAQWDLPLQIDFGQWTLHATYTCTRKDKGPGGTTLWTGKLEAAPVPMNITQKPFDRLNPPPP